MSLLQHNAAAWLSFPCACLNGGRETSSDTASERGCCWADYHADFFCTSSLAPRSLSLASAYPRNKVVPSNCSNGATSSLGSWPWLYVIRAGQCGLEVAPWVSSSCSVNSQYLGLNLFTLKNHTCFGFSNWAPCKNRFFFFLTPLHILCMYYLIAWTARLHFVCNLRVHFWGKPDPFLVGAPLF